MPIGLMGRLAGPAGGKLNQEEFMPCLQIKTNHRVSGQNEFMAGVSDVVCSVLGKPRESMMVVLEDEASMLFAGSRKTSVYMKLKGIDLDRSLTGDLSAELCGLAARSLDVPLDRIYIVFESVDRKMWGVNGTTF